MPALKMSISKLLQQGESEAFKWLVDSVRDYAIFLLAPDGVICSWNPGAERIKGYTASEVIGRHFSIFYTESALSRRWPQHELEVATRDGRFEDEGWRVRKDGGSFWANVIITAVRDPSGELLGFAKVTRDLTERRAHERALEDSERNLRLLVEGVQDYAIFQLNPDGIIISWNQGAERIKGYTAAEAIGQHFSIFYPEAARASLWPEEELRWASVRGRFEDEGWRLRKDGERIWANVVITAIRDGEGNLIGFSKVTRDLSERRRQETILREREEGLRQLVEGVQDRAMFLVDSGGIIRTWNTGGERLLGHSASTMIGREVGWLTEAALASIASLQEGGSIGPDGRALWEGWLHRADDSRFWGQVSTTAALRPDGSVRGYVQMIQDMSDRRRAENLEAEGKRLTEFIAMLSHELRNPLAPLSNALSLLKVDPLTTRGRWAVDMASRQVLHVTRLIEDLLDVSRVASSTIRVRLEPVDLVEVFRLALESVQSAVEANRHTMTMKLPEAAVTTRGDATRLTQVLVNLVTNAAKYTPEGGHIEVTLQTSHGLALLTVSDNGSGMNEELLSQAFEPFVQGERQLARADGGLGVGLTLVKRIAELHGGSVAATSPGPGLGTTVTVALPIDGSVRPSEDVPAEDVAAGDPLKILVVDDNPDVAESLVMLLRMEGHEVKVAHSATEALAIARASQPQVVLLDLGLPDVTGLELAPQLREVPGLEHATLIAVTGYGQDQDKEASRAAGFDHHLTKPVAPGTLTPLLYTRRDR
jgi:PAS domain S-box-containing protein